MPPSDVHCPVGGCSYTGPPASVAGHVSGKKDARHDWNTLGYTGANDYKRSQQSGDTDPDTARLGWLTDSHIGKSTGGYGTTTWSISPLADLETAIENVAESELDALVYTGDLFHNDRHGITETQRTAVTSALAPLQQREIPILYILGNHARVDGPSAWESLPLDPAAIHLSSTPYEVGNAAIYGVDYHPAEWWDQHTPLLTPTDKEYRVLCLHQSVAPYRSAETAEFNLRHVLRKMSTRLDGLPELVLLGHLHDVIDDELTTFGQTVAVRSYGATTRVGATRDSFAPGGSVLTTEGDTATYRRFEN